MKKNHYSFVTCWQLIAPVSDVWKCIYESTAWPLWWKGVKKVEVIRENDTDGVNGIREYTWKSALPYGLRFQMKLVEKIDGKLLRGIAFGELEGDGTWHFADENGVTRIQYHWNVETNKRWMNYVSFALKPLFKFNHNVVTRWAQRASQESWGRN